MNIPDFQLEAAGVYSELFREKGIGTFHEACNYVAGLPYGRNAVRSDFSLVLKEEQGSCSSKHALLTALAEENAQSSIELISGIFLMSPETHPVLTEFFEGRPYTSIPECHCYLRYKGERFDFTDQSGTLEKIIPRLVREQRIEPHQVVDWKVVIHKDYLERWLRRNPEIGLSLEELWKEREGMIHRLAKQDL